MSDDEADPELLELLRQSLGLGKKSTLSPPNTRVLESAEYIYDNAIDVSIIYASTKRAADLIWKNMESKQYSTKTWCEASLHPKAKDEDTLNFIFTMDLLNFSFWSKLSESERFCISYRDSNWTGYWSLVAALQRALDEGIAITTPSQWENISDSEFEHVFRSATDELMPMLRERIAILREAGDILNSDFNGSVTELVSRANQSGAALVNLLVEHFPSLRDEHTFHGKKVHIYKRAQIFVADVWACFEGISFGAFDDIEHLTVFADYRIPQMLESLNILWYSPRLQNKIKGKEEIESGDPFEVEIRGCTIWAAELLRREILRQHPEAKGKLNAVLLDFYLYDTVKEQEAKASKQVGEVEELPHHRTRSIWY